MPKDKAPAFYAVKQGRETGVFHTWAECEKQVKGYPTPRFKKFATMEEAQDFVDGKGGAGSQKRTHEKASSSSQDQQGVDEAKPGSNSSDGPSPAKKQKADAPENKAVESDANVVYIEGALVGTGKVGGNQVGIGVYWGPNSKINISERLAGQPQTNNRGEIHAAIRAIRQAKERELKEITIKTHNKYMVDSGSKWISGWKKRDWVVKESGEPVKNKEDFIELDAIMEGINVNWVHVSRQEGEPGNKAAGALAKDGARKQAAD